MSKFNSFAKRVDDLVKERFAEYRLVKAKVIDAEETSKKAQAKRGIDAEYGYKADIAMAELRKAREDFRKVKYGLVTMNDTVANIRREMILALNDEYASKPSDIDLQTVELLKSGILSERDYLFMLKNAPNRTMKRIIADSFGKWINANTGIEKTKAFELNQIVTNAKADDERNYIDAFDYLADAVNRTTKNESLFDRWEQITGNIVQNF